MQDAGEHIRKHAHILSLVWCIQVNSKVDVWSPSRKSPRSCIWLPKIPPTHALLSRHNRDSRDISSSPLDTVVHRGPLTFPDIAACMAHDLPVRSLDSERASHWKIMRHTGCNIRKTHRPTMHQSAQWGAPNFRKRNPVPGMWCIYGGYFWEPNARSGTFSSYVV